MNIEEDQYRELNVKLQEENARLMREIADMKTAKAEAARKLQNKILELSPPCVVGDGT